MVAVLLAEKPVVGKRPQQDGSQVLLGFTVGDTINLNDVLYDPGWSADAP